MSLLFETFKLFSDTNLEDAFHPKFQILSQHWGGDPTLLGVLAIDDDDGDDADDG